MSRNAFRFNPQRATQAADQRLSRIIGQPVRQVRERREAFDKMLNMITRVQQYATKNPGKKGLLVGDGYYILHNGEYFTVVKRGAEKVFEKSLMRVVTLFDPLQFVSGHLE
jgi:hypothetical protein